MFVNFKGLFYVLFIKTYIDRLLQIKSRDRKASSQIFDESGFSLLLVLLSIGFVGSVLSGAIWYQTDAALRKNAEAAGWHLVQLSKAARVFVRDAAITPVALASGVICCSANNVQTSVTPGSIEITVPDLINAGHLPAAFTSVNPLSQNMRVFAASYPPTTTPATGGQPIAGYVITDPPAINSRAAALANANMAVALMEGAREAGLSSSAPLIVGGNNLGDNCSGSPAVMIWDTGCLNQTDVNTVTAASGTAITVNDGMVIVPSWRSVDHDLRALMRYPQPENVGANTMLTDMQFGTPGVAVAGVETYTDDTGGANNRVNIINAGALTLSELRVVPQGFNDDPWTLTYNDAAGTATTMANIQNQVLDLAGGLNMAGDMTLTDTAGSGLQRALWAENGSTISVIASVDVTGGNMVVENESQLSDPDAELNTASLTVNTVTNIAGTTTNALGGSLDGAGEATGSVGAISAGIGGNAGTIITEGVSNLEALEADGEIRVFNTLSQAGSITVGVTNPNPYAGGSVARFQLLEGTTINVSGNALFEQGGNFGNEPITIRQLHVNQCAGDCPDETTNDPVDPTIP